MEQVVKKFRVKAEGCVPKDTLIKNPYISKYIYFLYKKRNEKKQDDNAPILFFINNFKVNCFIKEGINELYNII